MMSHCEISKMMINLRKKDRVHLETNISTVAGVINFPIVLIYVIVFYIYIYLTQSQTTSNAFRVIELYVSQITMYI